MKSNFAAVVCSTVMAVVLAGAASTHADHIVIQNRPSGPEPAPQWIGSDAFHLDHVLLKNGKSFDGEIVFENKDALKLEIFVPPGYTMARKLEQASIKTLTRSAHDGSPYVLIPVFGVIGKDITADALHAGLAKAVAAKASRIILVIDSPGGRIDQMCEMVDDLLPVSQKVEVVAYVKTAYSAAAVIAMCCPHVYLTPDGVIGAAVPFRMTNNGPADVDAKFRSGFEAKIRASAAQGGHADLLIRGMSEPDLEIYLTHENTVPVLRTTGPGKLIKSKGQILTLTAREASDCGLGQIATDWADLGKQVTGGRWYESTHRPWNAVVAVVEEHRQRERDLVELQQRRMARRAAIEQIRPECEAIELRINELLAKSLAAQNAAHELVTRGNAELQQVELEYQQALQAAQSQPAPTAAMAQAAEAKNKRAASVRQFYQTKIAALQAEDQAARTEAARLQDRERQMIASLPAE